LADTRARAPRRKSTARMMSGILGMAEGDCSKGKKVVRRSKGERTFRLAERKEKEIGTSVFLMNARSWDSNGDPLMAMKLYVSCW